MTTGQCTQTKCSPGRKISPTIVLTKQTPGTKRTTTTIHAVQLNNHPKMDEQRSCTHGSISRTSPVQSKGRTTRGPRSMARNLRKHSSGQNSTAPNQRTLLQMQVTRTLC